MKHLATCIPIAAEAVNAAKQQAIDEDALMTPEHWNALQQAIEQTINGGESA